MHRSRNNSAEWYISFISKIIFFICARAEKEGYWYLYSILLFKAIKKFVYYFNSFLSITQTSDSDNFLHNNRKVSNKLTNCQLLSTLAAISNSVCFIFLYSLLLSIFIMMVTSTIFSKLLIHKKKRNKLADNVPGSMLIVQFSRQ